MGYLVVILLILLKNSALRLWKIMFCGLVERNKFGVLVGFIQFGVNVLINLDLGTKMIILFVICNIWSACEG